MNNPMQDGMGVCPVDTCTWPIPGAQLDAGCANAPAGRGGWNLLYAFGEEEESQRIEDEMAEHYNAHTPAEYLVTIMRLREKAAGGKPEHVQHRGGTHPAAGDESVSGPRIFGRKRRKKAKSHQLSNDRGSMTLEMVIITPAMLLILGVAIFAGRVVIASQSVEHAADNAARTASLARTAPAAQAAADNAARDSLSQQGLRCTSTTVNVDTAGFSVPAGTPATITETITCVVNTADLAAPGIPGSRTVTGRAVSPLDTYRERQ